MFPEAEHGPSGSLQNVGSFSVARLIALQFGSPEGFIGLRHDKVLRAHVPETAVDEDCDFDGSKHDVRAYAIDPLMKSVSVARIPQRASQ